MSALFYLLKLGIQRAGIGAATGAGTAGVVSEGDPSAMTTGGIWGGLAGLAGHSVYETGGALARMGRLMRTPAARAQRMAAEAMKADELTPDVMRGRINMARSGVDPFYSLGEGNLLAKTEMAAQQPESGARNLAYDFFKEFAEKQEQRVLNETFFELGTSPTELKTVKALQTLKEAEAGPLYEKAYEKIGIHDDELDDLLRRAEDLGAFKHMQTIATADPTWKAGLPRKVELPTGESIYRLDTQHLDLVKRGLDQAINEHTDDLTGKKDEIGRAYTLLKRAIVKRADEINPDYAKARATYSSYQQSQDAVRMGRKFISAKIDDMDQWVENFNDLDPADQDFFRVGVAQAIKNKMLSGVEGQDTVKKFFSNRGTREKLREVWSSQASFEKFAATMDQEMKVARSKNVILGGSPTQRRQIEQSQMATEDLDLLGDMTHAARGNLLPLISSFFTRMKAAGIGPKTAKELMQMMLTTDRAGQLQLVDELAQVQKRMRGIRTAGRGAGTAVSGGLGALAGASEGADVPVE